MRAKSSTVRRVSVVSTASHEICHVLVYHVILIRRPFTYIAPREIALNREPVRARGILTWAHLQTHVSTLRFRLRSFIEI